MSRWAYLCAADMKQGMRQPELFVTLNNSDEDMIFPRLHAYLYANNAWSLGDQSTIPQLHSLDPCTDRDLQNVKNRRKPSVILSEQTSNEERVRTGCPHRCKKPHDQSWNAQRSFCLQPLLGLSINADMLDNTDTQPGRSHYLCMKVNMFNVPPSQIRCLHSPTR